jgi:hypothetical protein
MQDTFDDVYLMILGCDGKEYADKLCAEILPAKSEEGDGPMAVNETTPLVASA